MARQWGWVPPVIPLVLAGSLAASCSLGPRALDTLRLRYNEVVKTTSEEQLLLNIVRLRYTDTPSSMAVSTIIETFVVMNWPSVRDIRLMGSLVVDGSVAMTRTASGRLTKLLIVSSNACHTISRRLINPAA